MKPGPSGSGAKKKKYYLTDIMQFIIPFIKTATPSQSGNLTENEVSQDLQEDEVNVEPSAEMSGEEIQNGGSLKEIFSSENNNSVGKPGPTSKQNIKTNPSSAQESKQSDETPKKKVLRCKKPMDEVDKTFVNYLKSREQRHEANTASNTRKEFLMSLLDETEDMTMDQWKLFKRRVFKLIDEIKSPSRVFVEQFHNELQSPSPQASIIFTSPEPEQLNSSHHSHRSQFSVLLNNEQQLSNQYQLDVLNNEQVQIHAAQDTFSTPLVYSSAQNTLLQNPPS